MSYSIEDGHSTFVAEGIELLSRASARAKELANKRGESFFISDGEGWQIEVTPDEVFEEPEPQP